jgi:hypothetical protein
MTKVLSCSSIQRKGTRKLVKIDQRITIATVHYAAMKAKKDAALTVRCPTCGAKPGEKCELSTGQPRSAPHRDRRLEASKN